jgi:hypothetical protein
MEGTGAHGPATFADSTRLGITVLSLFGVA